MSVLLNNPLVSQFQFSPFSSGIFVPDLAVEDCQRVSAAKPQDLQALATVNRFICSEASAQPAPPCVRDHNSVKTVLANGSRVVESLFAYLGDDGMIDRSIDPKELRDLTKSGYTTQTIVRYEAGPSGVQAVSSVSKSMGGRYEPGKPDKGRFEEEWLILELTGSLLKEILADFGVGPCGLAELAAHFSRFIYLHGGIQGATLDRFDVIDDKGAYHPISFQDGSSFPNSLHNDHPHFREIKVVGSSKERPRLEMSFGEWGSLKEERPVEVRVLPGGPGTSLRLRGALCEIAETIQNHF